jgi:hypothetical protein
MLVTLHAYSEVVDSSSGGLEGYHRILFSSLDILAAKGGVTGTTKLFDTLSRDGSGSVGKDAFMLVLGEELIHHLDGRVVRDILLPKAEV